MKKHISTIILVLIFFIGLSVLLYPTVSDYWNSFRQSKTIDSYTSVVDSLNNEEYDKILQAAVEYNQSLVGDDKRFLTKEEQQITYRGLLNVGGDGIMGYVEIPEIDVKLPVYHGTDEAVLQVGIGHIEGSSLPVGGEGTHAVISGHRGLPSAKLFTNLDRIVLGDTFMLHILDEVMTYEVDQILIVEPHDVDALEIQPGKDLVTMVTCTPYGINSHRLLIRGHRIENAVTSSGIRVSADARQIEPLYVAPILAAPLLIILLFWLLLTTRRK